MGRRPPEQDSADVRVQTLDAAHEVWAHCPRCDDWFVVEDPTLETLLLCPVDLQRADETQIRLPA